MVITLSDKESDNVFSLFQTYVNYIRSLPICADPCVFGLHSNADITKDNQETNQLLDGVLLTLPRESGGGAKSPQVCIDLCQIFSLLFLAYAYMISQGTYVSIEGPTDGGVLSPLKVCQTST